MVGEAGRTNKLGSIIEPCGMEMGGERRALSSGILYTTKLRSMMGGGLVGVSTGKMIRDACADISCGRRGMDSKSLSSIRHAANAALSSCGTHVNTSSMSTGGGGSVGGRAFGGVIATSYANNTEGAGDEDT